MLIDSKNLYSMIKNSKLTVGSTLYASAKKQLIEGVNICLDN